MINRVSFVAVVAETAAKPVMRRDVSLLAANPSTAQPHRDWHPAPRLPRSCWVLPTLLLGASLAGPSWGVAARALLSRDPLTAPHWAKFEFGLWLVTASAPGHGPGRSDQWT